MDQTKQTFFNEISLMMYGFGDSHKPHHETVCLVEDITLKQLQTIVQEALRYSETEAQDKPVLKGKELIFLLRHNKQKMRRFVQYLKNKNMKAHVQAMNSAVIDVDPDPLPKGELMNFIELIDETGEFIDFSDIDSVKLERELRADFISEALNEKRYLQFSKARQASFCSKDILARNSERLRKWIDPNGKIEFRPNAMTVLQYFAYQTVAEITDYALLVRNDKKSGADPLQHLKGSYYSSTMFNGDHRFNGDHSNLDYSKVCHDQPPISVNDIKEVMRRVNCPQAGKLNLGGGKLPDTQFMFAL